MKHFHHWVTIEKYGNAYRIMSKYLVGAPLYIDGTPDYEALYGISEDAFTKSELADFIKDIEDATGWKLDEHYKLA